MGSLNVVVIGAGVVGLATAFHLTKQGASVTVFDEDPDGDKASFGNAGAIAVTEVVPASTPGVLLRAPYWLVNPLGPLAIRPRHSLTLVPWLLRFARSATTERQTKISAALSALNSRVYSDLVPLLEAIGLPHELRREGALTLYETERGYRRDSREWDAKRAHGIHCEDVTAEDARRLEPALGPLVHRAVWTPDWSHVGDPKRILTKLREWLGLAGARICKAKIVDIRVPVAARPRVVLADLSEQAADAVIVAAGAWSGQLAKRVGDSASLESERGYNMTIPFPRIGVTRELIFAERKFVATPLDCGLRIGGAAEFGGLDAVPNLERCDRLVRLAQTYLPDLRDDNGTRWAGHRPATPDSLPVIGRSPRHAGIYYAFGHGHLGLTQAATTGRLLSDLIFRKTTEIDLTPFSIERFAYRQVG